MFGIRFLPLSLSLIFLSAALGIEVFSTQPGARLHLSSCSGFFLHSASLDSPWITWEKELLCLLLLSIIAPATPTTGFICWRRMTSDTSASQAGLPLSPAQALFLVAEGAERVFNEIQTLGVSSHRLLKTSLLLTSVTNVRDQKKNLEPSCMEECCSATWMHNDYGKQRGGSGESQGFLKDSVTPLSMAVPFSLPNYHKKNHTQYGEKVTSRRARTNHPA